MISDRQLTLRAHPVSKFSAAIATFKHTLESERGIEIEPVKQTVSPVLAPVLAWARVRSRAGAYPGVQGKVSGFGRRAYLLYWRLQRRGIF